MTSGSWAGSIVVGVVIISGYFGRSLSAAGYERASRWGRVKGSAGGLDSPLRGGFRLGGMDTGLTIGEFSRITHLSIKTLRRYHEAGLLQPARVDRQTGYRYYI